MLARAASPKRGAPFWCVPFLMNVLRYWPFRKARRGRRFRAARHTARVRPRTAPARHTRACAMAVRWRPGLTLLALLVTATKSAAYWCDDMHPFVTRDFGLLGDFGSGPAPAAAAPLVNESRPLLHTETLTPTCGRADFYGTEVDVRAMRAEHLGANAWTLINSNNPQYVRSVDVQITDVNGVVYAHQLGAWYHDKVASASNFPETYDLTPADAKRAYDTQTSVAKKTSSANGYTLLKLTFSVQSSSSDHACDVQGRNLTNITAGCEAITDAWTCAHSYTSHNGVAIPCTSHGSAGGNCSAWFSCASGSLPKTIDWDSQVLVDMPELLSRARPPQVLSLRCFCCVLRHDCDASVTPEEQCVR